MSLHRHKVLSRPGPSDVVTIAMASVLALILIAGALAIPGAEWRQADGEIVAVRRVQHATSPDGRPHRVIVDYQYEVGGAVFRGAWEGEWPDSHSPNALPETEWERLGQEGFPLVVLYDPEHPARNSIHAEGNRFPDWWLRLSLALSVAVMWFVVAVYPHWKTFR